MKVRLAFSALNYGSDSRIVKARQRRHQSLAMGLPPATLHALEVDSHPEREQTTQEAQAGVNMAPDTVLRKLAVYETHSRYYLVGRSKSRQEWRVLKINRLVRTKPMATGG